MKLITPPCPICAGVHTRVRLAGLYDDRYGSPGRFDLWECADCDHQFLDAKFTPEQLGRLYTDYYPRASRRVEDWRPAPELGWWATRFGREDSAVFRWVPPASRVLDVGCGFGESLGYHVARGCEAWGIEADENIRRVAERFGFNARVGIFRAEDFPRDYFDFVTLDQVIEHAADPVQMLRDAAAVLRPGGHVLLGTPNGRSLTARWFGRRWAHLHIPYHLQLFSAQSLRAAGRAAGLEPLWVRQVTNPRWYQFQWLELLVPAGPGEPSLFWTEGRWPRGAALGRKVVNGVHRLGGNHLLAALLDGCGAGDNLVMALRKPPA